MDDRYIIYKIKELDKAILRNVRLSDMEFADKFQISNNSIPTQMKVLGYMIDNYGKEIYQKDLEEKLDLSRATISDVLKRMENNGLITRLQNENDVRSKRIILSDGANKVFEKGIERIDYIEKKAIKNISQGDLEVFIKVVNKMIKNIYEK